MGLLSSLSNLFASDRAGRRPSRRTPLNVERLDERLAPALVLANTWVTGTTLYLTTDSGDDVIAIRDTGRGEKGNLSIALTGAPAAQGSVFSTEPRPPAVMGGHADSHQADLDRLTAGSVIGSIQLLDYGGSNTVVYSCGRLAEGQRREIAANVTCSLGTNQLWARVGAVGDAASVSIAYSGGVGRDNVWAGVADVGRGGAAVLNLNGNGGANVVQTAVQGTVASGATVSVSLAGNGYPTPGATGYLTDCNALTLAFGGVLNGTLLFDIQGGAGRDRLEARLGFAAGSSGRVGSGNGRGASITTGGNSDYVMLNVNALDGANVGLTDFYLGDAGRTSTLHFWTHTGRNQSPIRMVYTGFARVDALTY